MLEPKCERNVQLSYGLGMSVLADVPITSPELVVGLSFPHSTLEIANQTYQAIGSWAGQSGYLSLGTWVPGLATGNPDIQAIGSWAGQSGYLGLGTRVPGLAMGNLDIHAIGSWPGKSG